jgi:LysR family transcriptional activator of nhaA
VNSPWINYHHLYYFKTIAEEGSVSKAASKLKLGQPTLSAQLKQLEDSLEIKLFDRKNKRLELTEQGELTLSYCKNIFQLGQEMYEALHDKFKANKVILRIGAIDSVPKQIVLHMVKTALKNKDCQILLVEGKTHDLLAQLNARQIDLLLTNFLPADSSSKNLNYRSVAKKPVCFYAAQEFKHLRKGFPQSLSGQPIILPTYDSKVRFDIDQWALSNKITLNICVESQDIALKKLLATEGVGLLPTSSFSVLRQVLSGELVQIGSLDKVFDDLLLISAQRKIENPLVDFLMKNFKI